ncbi:plasma-membrane choline transporter-domain-containing protein [Rhizophagus clarus]|uniref:Protein PNS1 n=1 Tax=Rhizophagus clarus TaxID=94130 RepID=A0A8H3R0Q8_9GLOM|nr:plasma-membrane choline transporter-domain-containing protein [Rhizophagus clarus]
MFSQNRKNFQSRDSVFSEGSEEPSASLFYSVPTLPTEAEIQESISLQPSRYEVEVEQEENEPDTTFLSEHSPMGYSNKQTAAEIYLNVPPTPVVKISDNTLSEGLLPTVTIPLIQLSGATHRKYNDPAFAVLFCVGVIIMAIVGIVLLFVTNSHELVDYSHKSIFFAIQNSIGPLLFAIIFSLSMGAIWILLLRSFVKVIIWGTLTTVPFICIAIFIWIRIEAFSGALRDSGKPDPQDDALAVLSFIPLIISIVYSVILFSRRKKIEKTISLIQLACDIFKDNPQMLWVSLKILMVYVSFTIIWLYLFSHIFLVVYKVQTEYRLEPNTYLLVIYFIFMYLWTSAVLSNIQRVTISGVVSNWYFYRHELDRNDSKKVTDLALSRAITVSFGTACLDGLILLFIQLVQHITGFLKNIFKNYPFLNCLTSFLTCIDGIIDNLNNYILVYVGISGKNFCISAYTTTKLFRSNLVSGLVNDFIAKSILYIGSVIIALLCGFATFIYATHSLESSYGYVVGIIAAIIPYYISQYYTYIMMSTVDATFIYQGYL